MINDELTKKINLVGCIQIKEPIKDLKTILNLYDKDYLQGFYYCITKKELGSNKQNLVNKIYKKLTDKKTIEDFMNLLIEDEYNEIIRIITNKGSIQDNYIKSGTYHYLRNFGCVHSFNLNNNLYTVIPDEIMNILNEINHDKLIIKIKKNTSVVKLAYSMVNLYGVVPMDLYIDCYKKNYQKPYSENDFDCVFLPERINSIRLFDTNENLYFTKEEFLDEPYDKAMIKKITYKYEDCLFNYDFKKINLKDLLNYYDNFYYEDIKQVKEFKNYLKSKNISDYSINNIIEGLIQSYRIDYYNGVFFLNEMFEDEKYEINKTNIDEILPYIDNIINNIPLWGNKGWTNKDIILRKCF